MVFLAPMRQDTISHCNIISIWEVLGFREIVLGLYKDEALLSVSGIETFLAGFEDIGNAWDVVSGLQCEARRQPR